MQSADLLLMAAAAGAVGALIRATSRLTDVARERALGWGDLAGAMVQAVLGASSGIIAVVLARSFDQGGSFVVPALAVALGFLAGLWADSAAARLSQVAERLFGLGSGDRHVMTLDQIESDIHRHIDDSSRRFHADGGDVWVVKYLAPRWLEKFMGSGELGISRTPGFTWGDGVYVAPLSHPYSSAMYGRAAIVGLIDRVHLGKIYDAADPKGIILYQRWIQFHVTLYRQLTTTIHADSANQQLRNIFRHAFSIDLVVFEPDETPAGYASASDRWYCVTDSATAPSSQPFVPATRVKDCRFVGIVGEEFAQEKHRADWPRYFAPAVSAGSVYWHDVAYPNALEKLYKSVHAANVPAPRGVKPVHAVNELVHVRPVS